MSKIRLYGGTSGYIELAAPDVSDDATLTLPTGAAGFVPGDGGIGSNIVQTVKTDTFSTSSTSFTNLTGLNVTITPTSATSKVLVVASIIGAGVSTQVYFNLLRGATTLDVGDAAGSRVQSTSQLSIGSGNEAYNAVIYLLDSPATTSATTYYVHTRTQGQGTLYINRSGTDSNLSSAARSISTITAIEVAA